MQGIETPRSHFIIFELFVIALVGIRLGKEIVQPIKHDGDHPCPKGPAFSEMGLKLNNEVLFTNPWT